MYHRTTESGAEQQQRKQPKVIYKINTKMNLKINDIIRNRPDIVHHDEIPAAVRQQPQPVVPPVMPAPRAHWNPFLGQLPPVEELQMQPVVNGMRHLHLE